MKNEELISFREQIDAIDDRLLDLFNQRAALVVQLARVKLGMGKKLFDPGREVAILNRVSANNPGPLPSDAVVRLYERVIDESRRLERTEVYDKAENDQT